MIMRVRADGFGAAVITSAIEESVEDVGLRIENIVYSYLYRNSDFPRPVEICVEAPPGFAPGWVRLKGKVRDSRGDAHEFTRLISREDCASEIIEDRLNKLKRSIDIIGNVAPSKTLGDLTVDLSNSIRTAYNSIFGRTCWGKAQSYHPADAVRVVYTSGPVTTLIFRNGVKFQVRKSDNDLLNKEKGLAMVVCKAILDKETYELLCKYAGKNAVITLAQFLMSPPEYAKLKAEKWKVF